MVSKYLHWLTLFVMLIIISQQGLSQINPKRIVEGVIAKRAAFEAIKYDIDFHDKRFAYDDTLNLVGNVELVRILQDTLFHGLVLIDMDTAWYGYDGEMIFYLNTLTNEVIYDNAISSPGLYILSNVRNNLLDEGFLKLNTGLRKIISEPEYEAKYSDTLIDGIRCLGIRFKIPDEEEGFTKQNNFVAIDTASLYIKRRTSTAHFQGNEQYMEWNFSNMVFGHETGIAKLDFKNFGNNVIETQFQGQNENNSKVLDFDWASLKGKIFNQDTVVGLKDFKAPFIILDFWYSSCYPCIKSIPAVRQIANTYKSKGVIIYGVNMIDDELINKSKLDKFMINNPMPYETIMLDKSYYDRINLNGFPTFVILDKNLQQVFIEDLYSENLFQDVSAFLDAKLEWRN